MAEICSGGLWPFPGCHEAFAGGGFSEERPGLLAVIGPSGSGKSSVVMAGLLPHLQAGDISGSEHWTYLNPMVPGMHPIESLVLTLGNCLTDRSLTSMREYLQDEKARGLHMLATYIAKQPGTKAVLVVDQFEELFTQPPTNRSASSSSISW